MKLLLLVPLFLSLAGISSLYAGGAGAQANPGSGSPDTNSTPLFFGSVPPESGNSAIVIYNRRVPESKNLAEYYASKRKVPSNQIFGYDLPTGDEISRSEFRDALQQPLAKELESRKLWRMTGRLVHPTNNEPARLERMVSETKIRYAVLCYGVPLKIMPDPRLKDPGSENLRPEMRRNEAAVDSELALLPALGLDLTLAGPSRNPAYSTTNAAALNPTNAVLMVARLDGPSPEIARGLVDKALQAESEGLWGRAYFDLRNTTEPGYKVGDDWIRNAAELCRRLGYETVVDENPGTFPAGFPMSQIAFYAGWYDQDVSGPFTQPTVEFMPGAFAYHLHSYSACVLHTTNRFWVGPLLAKGATISMGCVNEPYLIGTPDIAVFTARLVYHGFTFGEAAYASQNALSWQTTVVGDPLYRPFGKNPELLHGELARRKSKLIEWSFLRLVNLNLASGRPAAACAALLENLEATKQSAVLSEKLGELYSLQGKPSSAIQAWTDALKLDPSPQQRIRLLLTLGEKLRLADREPESYEAYQKLLRQFPAYPDRHGVIRKLLPLAQKLGHQQEAERLGAELQPPPQPVSSLSTNQKAGAPTPQKTSRK